MESLNRKRGTIKHKLTSFKKFANTLLSLEKIDEVKLTEIQIRTEKLESILEEFDKVQLEIEAHCEGSDEFQVELEVREEFENDFFKVIAGAKQLIENANIVLDEDKASVQSHNSSQRHSTSLKLPQIHLPKFSGDYSTWLEFRDTYTSLIHDRDIDDIEKFHYLRSALGGTASEVIHSLEFSSKNYQVAWNLLCDRFNNNSILVNNHVTAIFNLQTLQKESAIELRKLSDQLSKHLRSLRVLGEPTEHWDTLIIYIVSAKVDRLSLRQWEENKAKEASPKLDDFLKFLKYRADFLESLELGRGSDSHKPVVQRREPTIRSNKTFLISQKHTCALCQNDNHVIYNCDSFLSLEPHQRLSKCKQLQLCINCLKKGHDVRKCKSSGCKVCHSGHNTLLHFHRQTSVEKSEAIPESGAPKSGASEATPQPVLTNHFPGDISMTQVFLSTALIKVNDRPGTVRAILDSGSQANLITAEACSRLRIATSPVQTSIVGISQKPEQITKKCTIIIQSINSQFTATVSCLVVDRISSQTPSQHVNTSMFKIPINLKLADPGFGNPGSVDLLIGASLFWALPCIGQHTLIKDKLLLQKTKLGWVVAGSIPASQNFPVSSMYSTILKIDLAEPDPLKQALEKFWKVETVGLAQNTHLTDEERSCEQNFRDTYRRGSDGKFIVNIPLKNSPAVLGESLTTALSQYRSLERRLDKNPVLKEKYCHFINEYETLGHMSKLCSISEYNNTNPSFFLPHHGVLNEKSTSTKLRVVFNGSSASDNGISLNHLQMVGPTIQNDLFSMLIRFRSYKYVVGADISKMYRCVWVTPTQRPLQQILWRPNPKDNVQVYQLNTITYGTAAASYLAIRCIQQLAYDHTDQFPTASKVIASHFYVDDLLTGDDDPNTLSQTIAQVKTILASGGFPLTKWITNDPSILDGIGVPQRETIHFENPDSVRTLGVYWSCTEDTLQYNIPEPMHSQKVSKRSILAEISRIYDPLGLLAPVIILAKILIQQLWNCKVSWDESVPLDIYNQWLAFRKQIPVLESLKIQRWVKQTDTQCIELHGFSDASTKAYGACIYVRTVSHGGQIIISLLCAKSKVAPLKSLTIPRMELCAALMLSQLLARVREFIDIDMSRCYLWSDSQVTLHWINTSPALLQMFIANRVSQIQNLTAGAHWRYVPTETNPADLLSRGVQPKDFIGKAVWWSGPYWLGKQQDEWPLQNIVFSDTTPESRKSVKVLHIISDTGILPVDKVSSFLRLKRIVAYVQRFITNCRSNMQSRSFGSLTVKELSLSETVLIRHSQLECFSEEVKLLSQGKPLANKNRLTKLSPFLDSSNVLRVGGRLHLSQYSYDKKHPILLSAKHKLTQLLAEYEHKRLGHAPPQLLLSSIREAYWPIGGRNLTKGIVNKCTRCFRVKPELSTAIMSSLPASRVNPSRPFLITGVDYAGPLSIKSRLGRGCKVTKCYICLFICFSTKALHLELVSELTKDAFVNSLRRFCARRGKPSEIHSDNGTNFVATNKELIELGQFLVKVGNQIVEIFANDGISWHFNPPSGPHFGGLWEAGVKTVKYHLRRIMGNTLLTFEQLATVLAQIEAIVNSRPLAPLSSHPMDFEALTPAHFLVGQRLTTIPDPDLTGLPTNRLSHLQQLQQLQQHFWHKWTKEYVSQLQAKSKWRQEKTALQPGVLVVIKDDNLPPLKWNLGRVLDTFPGPDGVTRVVSVKTLYGVVKRPICKLGALPCS